MQLCSYTVVSAEHTQVGNRFSCSRAWGKEKAHQQQVEEGLPSDSPSWTSESATEPEAWPSLHLSSYYYSSFATFGLFSPHASSCMVFSLSDLACRPSFACSSWTFWACPVAFMLLPHSVQHSVGQGHCVQLCGVGHLQRDMSSRGWVSAHLHSPKHAASGAVCYPLEGTGAPFSNLYKGTWHVC